MLVKEYICCDDWTVQISKINSYIQLQTVRNPTHIYDGIPFKFCPWCGKSKMVESKK